LLDDDVLEDVPATTVWFELLSDEGFEEGKGKMNGVVVLLPFSDIDVTAMT
jgi:hypothetical protein